MILPNSTSPSNIIAKEYSLTMIIMIFLLFRHKNGIAPHEKLASQKANMTRVKSIKQIKSILLPFESRKDSVLFGKEFTFNTFGSRSKILPAHFGGCLILSEAQSIVLFCAKAQRFAGHCHCHLLRAEF